MPDQSASHPSGLPRAPWGRDNKASLYITGCDGVGLVRIAPSFATDTDGALHIAAAAAVLPDLAASCAKLVAAYEAWMATVEGTAEDRAALDRWDEIAAVETGVIGGLLKAAGIPLPELDAPAAAGDPEIPAPTAGPTERWRCRVCGCTDDRACVDRNGKACGWASPGLCTACAPTDAALDEAAFRPGGSA